jgi:molecular chaperone DnaK (HSP70)
LIIGIDLGTTNSALAYGEDESVQAFPVEQVVQPNEVRAESLLPSFIYLSGPNEMTALPWDEAPKYTLGALARRRGAETMGRLVSSAKSWLHYSNEVLLPVHAPEGVEKISPVDASRAYL